MGIRIGQGLPVVPDIMRNSGTGDLSAAQSAVRILIDAGLPVLGSIGRVIKGSIRFMAGGRNGDVSNFLCTSRVCKALSTADMLVIPDAFPVRLSAILKTGRRRSGRLPN